MSSVHEEDITFCFEEFLVFLNVTYIYIYIYVCIYIYKIPRMQCLTLPNFTTAATNGAITYDQENMLTTSHEDSYVPQQCARARSLLFF